MAIYILLCIIGFVLLYYGAEWLVKGASSLARSLGLTPMVIGLTVVAFGTSVPEFVVSVISSLQQKSMIAVGNVVGSNICNIALVLGLVSLFMPIKSNKSVVNRDIPIIILISLYLLLVSLNSNIGRFEGFTMLCGIILYTCFNVKAKHAGSEENYASELEGSEIEYIPSKAKQITLIIAGIILVVVGVGGLIIGIMSKEPILCAGAGVVLVGGGLRIKGIRGRKGVEQG